MFSDQTTVSMDKLKWSPNKNDFEEFAKMQKDYNLPGSVIKGSPKRATFQRAMRLAILIGQCFGLNPVLGVCESDSSKLRFTFYSGRCIYTILSIMGQSMLVILCIMKLVTDTKTSLSSSTSIVFYTTNCLTTCLFLRIAMKWPQLCQLIAKLEAAEPNADGNLVKRCNVSCVVVLLLAALEHILSDVSGISVAIDCHPDTNLYEAFILQSFPWIWRFIPYNAIFGFFSQFFNIQCTFNWNFSDAFVICISWYLTARLKQVNQRIVDVRGRHVSLTFWRNIREDYSRAANLVRKVDDVINSIIFVSFANNLFFICLQFLHILEEGVRASALCNKNLDERPMRGYEQPVYFIYSFAFLLTRSLAVSLIAAKVHSASKLPGESLYDVPSSSYCIEVHRFMDQVHGDTVALSGLQFFNVKRGLVLTIAGTIVTYELVLMQFTGVNPTATPLDSLALGDATS